MIKIHTNHGAITLKLDAEKAPQTVKNFLAYAESGHYNGTIFHRVIDGFMIQGGGMDAEMKQKSTQDPVQNEAKNGLKNKRGTIAMARTADPHSATAQFFINVSDNGFLDYPGQDGWGYCVFGEVTEGMDVVDKIKGVATGRKGFHQDVPKEPVTIDRVEIVGTPAQSEPAAQTDDAQAGAPEADATDPIASSTAGNEGDNEQA